MAIFVLKFLFFFLENHLFNSQSSVSIIEELRNVESLVFEYMPVDGGIIHPD